MHPSEIYFELVALDRKNMHCYVNKSAKCPTYRFIQISAVIIKKICFTISQPILQIIDNIRCIDPCDVDQRL